MPKTSSESVSSGVGADPNLMTLSNWKQNYNARMSRSIIRRPEYPALYVSKRDREYELRKLDDLKQESTNIRNTLARTNMNKLPRKGTAYIKRLQELDELIKEKGSLVSNMVVYPEKPNKEVKYAVGYKRKSLPRVTATKPRLSTSNDQASLSYFNIKNLVQERLKNLNESLESRPPETVMAPTPNAITSEMMLHQLHALAWLQWRETQSPRGGILADDMGLGKTLSVISLIASDYNGRDIEDRESGRRKSSLSHGGTLVVCPASLLHQWVEEIKKHCAAYTLSICVHHGPKRSRYAYRLAAFDVVITTYNIVQGEKRKNGALFDVNWRRIVLDEAHCVRNHKSVTSAAVTALKGKRRWCLTGTPVQNKGSDLFALFKFLRCTPFDELDVWQSWVNDKKQSGQDVLDTFARCMILRRTKEELRESKELDCLPQRSSYVIEVTLTEKETYVYQMLLHVYKTIAEKDLKPREEAPEPSSSQSGNSFANADNITRINAALGGKYVPSQEILVVLLRLRQACCHCGLIASTTSLGTDGDQVDLGPVAQDLIAELDKTIPHIKIQRKKVGRKTKRKQNPTEGHENTLSVEEAIRLLMPLDDPVFDITKHSSKIKAVMDCLNMNVFSNASDKAIVVSQWTSVLLLLEEELKKARIKYVVLSGAVPVAARNNLVKRINDHESDVRVMLLSLCAGGVGLNLCGANHLLLVDPHWNPQLERQAQDRIYRVGQMKPVSIYRFISMGTLEEKVRDLQQNKLTLAETVLSVAEAKSKIQTRRTEKRNKQ